MSEPQTPDYKSLLERAGAQQLSDLDVADLTPGLRAIDGKIAFLRDLASKMDDAFPDPIATTDDHDA